MKKKIFIIFIFCILTVISSINAFAEGNRELSTLELLSRINDSKYQSLHKELSNNGKLAFSEEKIIEIKGKNTLSGEYDMKSYSTKEFNEIIKIPNYAPSIRVSSWLKIKMDIYDLGDNNNRQQVVVRYEWLTMPNECLVDTFALKFGDQFVIDQKLKSQFLFTIFPNINTLSEATTYTGNSKECFEESLQSKVVGFKFRVFSNTDWEKYYTDFKPMGILSLPIERGNLSSIKGEIDVVYSHLTWGIDLFDNLKLNARGEATATIAKLGYEWNRAKYNCTYNFGERY